MEEGQDARLNGQGQQERRSISVQRFKDKVKPGFKITLLLSLILYLSMLIVGSLSVNHCPVNENIPLFLIATGIIGLLSKFITFLKERLVPHFPVTYLESSLYTVELVFLILGAYWVFKEYPPSYHPSDRYRYCWKSGYLFAFIYLAIVFAITLASIAGFICFLGTCCFLQSRLAEETDGDVEAGKPTEEAKDMTKEPQVQQAPQVQPPPVSPTNGQA